MQEMISQGGAGATNTYIWGMDLSGTEQGAGGIGGLLARITQSGSQTETVYYCYDHNGNIQKLLNGSGAVAAEYQYDAFGRLKTSSENLLVPNSYRFSTKYYDAESDMNYYGYRFYSPQQGRWLSRDPIGEKDSSLYLYSFTDNAPVSRVDVDGRSWWSVDSETDLFFGFFYGWGGQVQVTLKGTCCDDNNVKYEYNTLEVCGGAGIGGWGGGAASPVHQASWGKLPCPPGGARTYTKVIGAVTGNYPGAPGVIVTGEIGDEGTEISVGIGAGAGVAFVGCVAFTTSSAAGCCDE